MPVALSPVSLDSITHLFKQHWPGRPLGHEPCLPSFPFKGRSAELPLARTCPCPDGRFPIGGALPWVLHPLRVRTKRKMIPLLWIDTLFFRQACKVLFPGLLGKYLPWLIVGLKHWLSRETRWWFWTFGIWNPWWIEIQPCVPSEALVCQGKMYFIQPQAWPPRALKGLTYSKVHYQALH